MANFMVPENPEFNDKIRKFETTDPGHAAVFNEIIQGLVNNDGFLKKMTEQHIDGKVNSDGSMHIPSGGSSGQVLKYGGASGTAEWGWIPGLIEGQATCVTLWQGVIYETGEWLRFYVPKQYWHNNNLTLMIDCVKYQYDESATVNPTHSKTVMATLTLPHELYVAENDKVKFRAYSAAYNQNGKINICFIDERFSGTAGDVISIIAHAYSLITTDYAEVEISKNDANQYAITDIYAVIPQAQEQEG